MSSFKDSLASYSATQIMAALGCPRGTAYDWLDGRRKPPAWQQRHWLELLKAKAPSSPPRRKPPR